MGVDVIAVVLAFGVLLVTLAMGVPVALGLTAAGIVGIIAVDGVAAVTPVLGARMFRSVFNFALTVVPLFVIMGFFVNHARIGEDLFAVMARVLRRVPGGLGLASIAACAGFGAVTGASVTGVATIGPMSIREMRKYGYTKEFSAGLIAAAGTLGILIPPSISLAIYGFVANVSVGRLLIAGLIPGILSAIFYGVLTVMIGLRMNRRAAAAATADPVQAPASTSPSVTLAPPPVDHDPSLERGFLGMSRGLVAALKILVIFVIVFGGIYLGIATVTESAALGALAAFLMLVFSGLNDGLRAIVRRTADSIAEGVSVSSMFFFLLVGGAIFGYFLLISGVPSAFARWATALDVPPAVVVIVILLGLVVLGMFLDGISILLISVPLTFPIVVEAFGYSPIWYGVMLVKTIEIGLITPPLGINAFVVAGLSKDIKVENVFRGVVPFFIVDLLTVAVFFMFPAIITWLPDRMMG